MELSSLRVALFSGNYNYVRDGANQALNRLVGTLLRHGAHVRIYSPTVAHPAFPPTGDLVPVTSIPVPGRGEYRLALGLTRAARQDLDQFAPTLVHVSAPDWLGHSALGYARSHNLPVVGSVHTRFDTYASYYRLAFLQPILAGIQKRFYDRCDRVVAPSESMAALLHAEGLKAPLSIWSRGVDRTIFNPERRDEGWRATHGFAPDDMVVGFFGRVVMEKGLETFAQALSRARALGSRARVLVVGDGPAREGFARELGPDAKFTGFLQNADLAEAVAAMDVLLNPSLTETFGNVTLEAMACGVPVVGARATGTDTLVIEGTTGRLIAPGDVEAFARALLAYEADPQARRAAGQAGAQRAEGFGWDELNLNVARTYFQALGHAHPRIVAAAAGFSGQGGQNAQGVTASPPASR